MKKILLSLFAAMFFSAQAFAAGAVERWADFEHELRRGNYTSAEAELKAKNLIEQLAEQFKHFPGESAVRTFPVEGYKLANVERPARFLNTLAASQNETNFFASDRFAQSNYLRFNVIDPRAQEKGDANMVAAAAGIVVFVRKGSFGGGNYVWVFNPNQNLFYYYGNLKDIFVKLGEVVQPGQRIATIRPAKKGYPVHFTVLRFDRGDFSIYNFIDQLP